MCKRAALVVLSGLLPACASITGAPGPVAAVPPFVGAQHDDGASLPDIDGFLAIDEAMREFVRTRLKPVADPLKRLQRLSAELLGPDGFGIRYDGELTLTAREVFHRRAGNCLSFSALVVALARDAGLQAGFRDVPVLPQYRISGSTYVIELHVNALIRVRSQEFVIDFRPPNAATNSSARAIDDANATAQYFGNLGIERFTAGDLEGAYWLLRRGLQVDPRSATLWIDLGVVLGRNRQWPAAEQAYRTALTLDPGNLSALNNLALLLAAHGDPATARELRVRVEKYRRTNPYYLYWLGEQQLQSGSFDAARKSFAAAVQRMPGEAEFHFAMARAYRALGENEAADQSFRAALDSATSTSIRERFAEQYRALQQVP